MTRTQQVKAFNSLAACSDGAGKRRRRGAGCNFFALNFQLFSAALSERGEREKKGKGKGGGGGVCVGGKMAFHKDAVTFSSIITCSPLSPAFARRRIPAPPRRKRSEGKISQELHHGPRGTCSSGGESRASRSVDTNPHHKNVLVEGGGQRQPRTSFCGVIISPPAPWVPAEGTDRRTFCWEAKRGGCDVKGWKSLRAGGKNQLLGHKKEGRAALLPGTHHLQRAHLGV